ncbi:MAG: GPO family capsid scaffolding protein, partial [Lysobacter sp.]
SPYTARKQSPENVFSAAEETVIEFEDEPAAPGPSLFARIKTLLTGKATTDDARFADVHSAVEHVAQATTEHADALAAMRQDFAALRAAVDAIKARGEQALADLAHKIDHTPNAQPARPAAAGGGGAITTDC